MRYSKWTFAVLAALLTTLASAQLHTYGDWAITGTTVSNGGTVAGYDYLAGQYITWNTSNGIQHIGGQAPGDGHGGWPSITPDGSRIGGTALNPVTNLSELAYYDFGTTSWTLLGSLGSSSGASASSGFTMSGDGTTVAGNAWVNAGTAHAVYAKNGTVTDLGLANPDRSSRVDGINHDGTVMGGWQEYADGYWGGSVWVNGVQHLLTNGNGDPLGIVGGVSGDGQWAVGEGGYYGNYNAYRWNPLSGIQELDNPFAADEYGMRAVSTNYDGSIIIGYAQHQWDFWQPRKGWIWTESTGTMTMEAYAASLGFYNGETLSNAYSISSNGEWILGQGWDATGMNYINWALHNPNPVPEPATLAALGLGLAAIVRRRRK